MHVQQHASSDFCLWFSMSKVVMKRAQSMAQAAWTRPSLRLSSWSCMGPRHRATTSRSSFNEESNPECSSSETANGERLLSYQRKTTGKTMMETVELPVSSAEGIEWTSEIECSCSEEVNGHADGDADGDGGEDLTSDDRHEDRLTEVELWQQLEHDLYSRRDGEETDVEKEIREEEAAAMAEVGEAQPESSAIEIKEAHRFFPPGKIMHIITLHSDEAESDTANTCESDTSLESKVGIFLTPRSLYSKIRLCQTMVADHFMPVYRRKIEKLIGELEKEGVGDEGDYSLTENTREVVL